MLSEKENLQVNLDLPVLSKNVTFSSCVENRCLSPAASSQPAERS